MKQKVAKHTPNRIAEIRANKGLTIEQVAILLEEKPMQVEAWEKGFAVPHSVYLLKLCVLLDTSLELLYPEVYKQLLADAGE